MYIVVVVIVIVTRAISNVQTLSFKIIYYLLSVISYLLSVMGYWLSLIFYAKSEVCSSKNGQVMAISLFSQV